VGKLILNFQNLFYKRIFSHFYIILLRLVTTMSLSRFVAVYWCFW